MPSNAVGIPSRVNSALFLFLNALISVFIYYLQRLQKAVVISEYEGGTRKLIVKDPKPLPNGYIKYAKKPPKVEATPAAKHAEIKPKLDEKPKTAEIPQTDAKKTRSDHYPKPAATRVITTSFESTFGYDHMLAEIRKELDKLADSNMKIVCCEVNWMCPSAKRSRKLEQLIREALNRPFIADKWSLAEELRMKSVPNSITEEYCKIHQSGKIMGSYRQFTPKLLKFVHAEATGEHSYCWEFNPDGIDWERVASEHLEKNLNSLCMVTVNLLGVRY